FFFNDSSTAVFYTLSLHDALPISEIDGLEAGAGGLRVVGNENDVEVRPLLGDVEKELSAIAPEEVRDIVSVLDFHGEDTIERGRSEEHTSELQSRFDLVCRLLLEK